ncbi:MAG: hypothetical protein KDI71_24420 [Xanthomonadales bacterium]|nr:hypothetical protein [Xanthomonadales bacterium]
MRKGLLTARGLSGLKPGQSVFDPAPRGQPKLEAIGGTERPRFYVRYVKSDGSRDRYPLGFFDPSGRDGLTLAEARERAGNLAKRHAAGERDLREFLEAEAAENRALLDAAEAAGAEAAKAASEAEKVTLTALCEAYANHLEKQGKASARQVRNALALNVTKASLHLSAKPAAAITPDDVLELLELLTAAGKNREAGKLRSYLRAAFGAAINAKRSPGALPALRKIGKTLTHNPVRDLGTVAGSSKTRDRTLSVAELRAYWQKIQADSAGALLRFHLLTGAQRLEQLARATVADVDEDAKAFLLLDAKGRRSEPRQHWVPLLSKARAALTALRTPKAGDFLFSLSHGENPTSPSTVAQILRRVAGEMLEAKEIAEPFTAGDIRRTVETRLAALGVPLEVRAQLQSHGLGGVQARHYDRHDYMTEKREALQKLLRLLESKPATVTPIRERRSRA